MARGIKPQIGASSTAISEYLQTTDSKAYQAFALMSSLALRNTTFQTFGINRQELSTLFSLFGYLTNYNRVLISQNVFIDHLTGNFNTKRKIHGYIKGLFTLKAIGSFEYTKIPGSISLGITDHGFEILKSYWSEVNQLFGRYILEGEAKKERQVVKYPDLSVSHKTISISENIPQFYRAYQKQA